MGLLSVWAAVFVVLLMVFEGLASPETRTMSFRSVCPLKSIKDSIFMGFHQDLTCPLDGIQSSHMAGVIQVYKQFALYCIIFSAFCINLLDFWVFYLVS